MFRDDDVRVRHILDAAREAVDFIENRSRAGCTKPDKLHIWSPKSYRCKTLLSVPAISLFIFSR